MKERGAVLIPNPGARLAAATAQQVPSAERGLSGERALPKSQVQLPVSLHKWTFISIKRALRICTGRISLFLWNAASCS